MAAQIDVTAMDVLCIDVINRKIKEDPGCFSQCFPVNKRIPYLSSECDWYNHYLNVTRGYFLNFPHHKSCTAKGFYFRLVAQHREHYLNYVIRHLHFDPTTEAQCTNKADGIDLFTKYGHILRPTDIWLDEEFYMNHDVRTDTLTRKQFSKFEEVKDKIHHEVYNISRYDRLPVSMAQNFIPSKPRKTTVFTQKLRQAVSDILKESTTHQGRSTVHERYSELRYI